MPRPPQSGRPLRCWVEEVSLVDGIAFVQGPVGSIALVLGFVDVFPGREGAAGDHQRYQTCQKGTKLLHYFSSP